MIKPTVVVEINQGVVDVVRHRGGLCRIIIRDYDVDGINPGDLVASPNGDCIEQVFDLPQEPRRKRIA